MDFHQENVSSIQVITLRVCLYKKIDKRLITFEIHRNLIHRKFWNDDYPPKYEHNHVLDETIE